MTAARIPHEQGGLQLEHGRTGGVLKARDAVAVVGDGLQRRIAEEQLGSQHGRSVIASTPRSYARLVLTR